MEGKRGQRHIALICFMLILLETVRMGTSLFLFSPGTGCKFFFFLFYFKGSGMTPSLTFVVIQQCWNVSPVVKHFCVSFGDSVFAIGIFFLYSLRCLYIYTIKYCHIYTLFLFSFPLSAQYLLHNFMPPPPPPPPPPKTTPPPPKNLSIFGRHL